MKRPLRGAAALPGCKSAARCAWLALALSLLVACGGESWSGEGVVLARFPDDFQVLLRHDAIEGLMPAMTMNFHVEGAVLAELPLGERVRFRLRRRGNVYEIVGFEPLSGLAGRSGGGTELAGVLDPAQDFTLRDQDGREVSLSALRGKLVLLDFIFTHCPGPCPILTATKQRVQEQLGPELWERTQLLSVSVDPLRDRPEVLRAFAEARGVDLSNWSFLTGTPEAVDAVLRAYGVGSAPGEGGEIEHTVASFLIDPQGRIRRRYLGSGDRADEILADLRHLAGVSDASEPGASS